MGVKFQREDNLDKMFEDFLVLPIEKKIEKEDPVLKKAMASFDEKEKNKEKTAEKKAK